ncbi:ccr4-associated factor family protein [Cardiosporidium cionae]|uniref:poly(A)-specific ribonuclease n=1 Tax=Cardiosporidium cionae TaxID=476202 RepID=A0ABQ7J858_9APIC|nr:ccr4-associated factor family protein [Cardiosporidium cionae]|eukprot:KAF8819865.1 ccr4-associated factor family protein [Cardiosporidium cionae]
MNSNLGLSILTFVLLCKRFQITEVWADNLEEEFERIRDVVENYQYVAMDTEFPGIVARPAGNCMEYNYQTVKCNVDLLKVIQLGITFADSQGNLADGTSTWQFNFSFDLDRDMYAQDSIDFLKQSGIDFDQQQKKGISLQDFGELIMSSGLVMNEDVKWISFHGCYDFGYLLKLLTCAPLPVSEAQFFELLHDFFPALYDIKFLLKNVRNLNINGGQSLQKIADHLNVKRIGRQHQAGSDSLVTKKLRFESSNRMNYVEMVICRSFFKLMETYFDNQIDDSKFSGVIYGLGATALPKHSRSALETLHSSMSGVTATATISVGLHDDTSLMSPLDLNPYTLTSNGYCNAPSSNCNVPSPVLVASPIYHPPSAGVPALSLNSTGGSGGPTHLQQLPVSIVDLPPSFAQSTSHSAAISSLSLSSASHIQQSSVVSSSNGGISHPHLSHMLYGGASANAVSSDFIDPASIHMQQQQLNVHIQEMHWNSFNMEDLSTQNVAFGNAPSGSMNFVDRMLVMDGHSNENTI